MTILIAHPDRKVPQQSYRQLRLDLPAALDTELVITLRRVQADTIRRTGQVPEETTQAQMEALVRRVIYRGLREELGLLAEREEAVG